MALAVVGEAFVSASVELLLEKIVSGEFVNFFLIKKLDESLLHKMQTTLLSLRAVLNDAEEKQFSDADVKQWLDMLRHAVFDVEDLLDEINTEALRSKVEAEYRSKTVCGKVQNILSSPFKRSHGVTNSKMQTLFEKLQNFERQIHSLGLRVGVSSTVWHGTPSSSVVIDESAIYGRDEDRKKLKDYLLSDKNDIDNGNKIGVISIVGMGGIGKTTLAKLLYNDPDVKEKFDLKAWAHISKDFDVFKVTQTILESITSKTIDTNSLNPRHLDSVPSKKIDTTNQNPRHLDSVTPKITDTSNLNTLQVQLQQSLSHKIFLLVLDDIWEGKYSVDWYNLMDIFKAGKMGSRIIITTRHETVALAAQTFLPIHHLEVLGNQDCWSLFSKLAFGPCNCDERSNLEGIGIEIAKKCGGLPLAAVALGGLLRNNPSQREWKKVLESNIWDLPNVQVQPALLLSYHYLPSVLKRCFAYCSIFPKNSKLEKRMVVQLWIAEGFVHPKRQESMEETGDAYFDDLVSRSLILQRLDEQKPHGTVRHLSYNRGIFDSYSKFYALRGSKGLRTFLPLNELRLCYFSKKTIDDLLLAMKQLRVLSLSNYRNVELPDSIGHLIHLRYLNLSNTWIERLPSKTCKLYNLQTLLLSNCKYLTELPKDMGKLVNLRHLDISGTELREMPAQIATLQSLQTLSDFIVGEHRDGLKIVELSKFPHLQANLSISGLQNVKNHTDASLANLKMKKQIDELVLKWNDDADNAGLVLERLEASTNLKKLSIRNYGETKFPNWVGDSSFGNMVYLVIWRCTRCSLLPPLGQLPKLKELLIVDMRSLKTIGGEFRGSSSLSFQPFQSLEILSFRDMPEWEEWNLSEGTVTKFPSLKHLTLEMCPKLNRNIPGSNFPSLTKLELDEFPLSTDFPQSQLMLPFSSVCELSIRGFSSLKSFPRDGLPKTLQSLFLSLCGNLEFLPRESLHNYKSLENLTIKYSCDSMDSFTLGSLPVLKSLSIYGCRNLKSISTVEDASSSLSLIRSIEIRSCDELESISPAGLPTPNLIHFNVSRCYKLVSLPKSINTLTGLQKLAVFGLQNLQSFATEGLPTNLRELDVGFIGGISSAKSISQWRLECLTCLSVLRIRGDDMVKMLMEMEVPFLPTSLTSLTIYELDNTKFLDGRWLQHLTSLQNLRLQDCYILRSLPERLPSSLKVLEIWLCSKIKRKKEWPKIAHVPTKIIQGIFVE
ncbi:putative disease resistance RPP13-like protein 1 [Abrus precatorius]|uniref:Disease resistance RPP13-like protein 1 n=1 Tax=Abrus precatorius TaxID=3816 RepID=A0A8B8KH42_ABRPR|nr:putative disease resistance RPP13-like protein 1 [Abrus precatorius]